MKQDLPRAHEVVGALLVVWLVAASAGADYVISQESSTGGAVASYQGQSFTTGDMGSLTQVDVGIYWSNVCTAVTLRVYEGNQSPNNGSLAKYQESIAIPAGSGTYPPYWDWTSLVLATPVALSGGNQYTFELACNASQNLVLARTSGNPYAGGNHWAAGSLLADNDLVFRAHIRAASTIGQETGTGQLGAQAQGQSFTTVETCALAQIDVGVYWSSLCTSITLRVYEGNQSPRNGSLAIYEESFVFPAGSGDYPPFWDWTSLVLASPVGLASGAQYTFEVVCNTSQNLVLYHSSSGGYSGGHLWVFGDAWTTDDMTFRVHTVAGVVPAELQSFTVE